MNSEEFKRAFDYIVTEKGIDEEVVKTAMQDGFSAAYKKNTGENADIYTEINTENGKIKIFRRMTVVEEIENEDAELCLEEAKEILFVAFPSNRGGYSIKTVPKSIDDRTARLDFPLEWGGKSQEELEKISNIDGLTFCHTARFIVACKDLDAVHAVLEKMCKVDD